MSEIVINGETRPLKLTLGALAEIEAALGGGDFEALRARLASPRVSDLLVILRALIAGGGAGVTLEALKAADIDFAHAAGAIAEAFNALGDGAPKKPREGSLSANGSPSESSL